jgi:CubicO group peptidase (beta-lactamase class C family)
MSALLFCVVATMRSSEPGVTPGADQIAAVFSSVTAPDAPGLAVLVRKGGRIIFERGYGLRDLRTPVKIDSRTNFRLASCTKQFTAMAIMLLVHDGKLTYDTRLTDVFPDFPAYGRSIAIGNLLNHTSGLVDYESLIKPQDPTTPPDKVVQIEDAQVLRLLEQQTRTKFAPGTKWEYSNSAYVVLGLMVQKISGEPFADFLRGRIFAPLKMKDTVAFVKGKNEVPNRAFGYSKNGNSWELTDQSPTSATLGDGGIYSSVSDLAKWDEALKDHTLLSAKEMRLALTPVVVRNGARAGPGGQPAAYGFGWFLDPYKGHSRMWHDGETTGFRTTIQRFTADELSIIVLSNRTDLNPGALADRVADLFFTPSTRP